MIDDEWRDIKVMERNNRRVVVDDGLEDILRLFLLLASAGSVVQ
jgi:hypothetical protein